MTIRRFTTFAFVLMIASLIMGLYACEQIQQLLLPTTPQMEGPSGEIAVGVVLPQTGHLGPGEFGPGALVMENGFNMALEEINNSQPSDVKLKFIIENDQSTVEGAAAAFNKLIHQDRVPVILGVWTSHVAQSVFPIAQENGIVAFSPVVVASDLTAIGDFIFRASHSTDVAIPGGVKVTQEKLGYQSAATIYDESDLYSTDSNKVVREALNANGVEILTKETYQTGETDFSPQLTRIKEVNPDAIFISALAPEMIKIMIQARQLGISADIPFIVPDLTGDEVAAAGEAAEGAVTFTSWTSTADTPGNRAFVQNYQAKYGADPNPWAAQSYAALYILAEAIASAQSIDAAAIRDALANINNFDTVLGQFSFNAVGDADYDLMVLIVQDGNFEAFE